MPLRPAPAPAQAWLFPPSLDELLPPDHPARFVAAVVQGLTRAEWSELGVAPDGEQRGAAAYHPQVLLAVWLYGFMTRVRSCRKLEAACRDQLSFLWLTGWQYPDHNTLWRFYEEHRDPLRQLFRRTVRTAVRAGLVDLALQAVDGTKLEGNVAKEGLRDEAGLARLLEQTEAAIRELEAGNQGEDEPPPSRLPQDLVKAKALRTRVQEALERVRAEEGPNKVALTDPEAVVVKGRQGLVVGYNAQAVASPLNQKVAGRPGRFLTAADVVAEPDDQAQLVPMLAAAEENIGQRADLSLGDGGYLSGKNLAACEERRQAVALPPDPMGRYHKETFSYDAATDSYRCTEGTLLPFNHVKKRKGQPAVRVYRAPAAVCRACPLFGRCTKDRRGRSIERGPYDEQLRRHRAWMAQEPVQQAYRRRKTLIEPVFGIVKEALGVRRFLLRGLRAVRAEWTLLATAFNLRVLWQVWRRWTPERRAVLTEAAAA